MNASEQFLNSPPNVNSWRNSRPIQRMRRYGAKWPRDGFESLTCLNAKTQWPTLLAQESDVANPCTVGFIRNLPNCLLLRSSRLRDLRSHGRQTTPGCLLFEAAKPRRGHRR